MTTPQLSFITTCRGRLPHLQATLASRLAQAGCETIVVDYGCPQQCGQWVRTHHPQAHVVLVKDARRFEGARARNLGARVARAPWLMFVDADVTLDDAFAERVLPSLRAGQHFRFIPSTQESYGNVVCAREDFEAIDGYDEAIVGWGGADSDLYYRLGRLGRPCGELPGELLSVMSHDDALRFADYDIKNKATSQKLHVAYCHAKYQMEFDLGVPLPLAERHALFGKLRAALLPGLLRGDNPAVVTLHLPELHHLAFPEGVKMRRRLVFELHETGEAGLYPFRVL